MRCSICGKPIAKYGNNPFPLCNRDDMDNVCCDECNDTYVISARILSLDRKNDVKLGDGIAIFYADSSNEPIACVCKHGKFLAGIVTGIETEGKSTIYTGTWGTFLVNSKTDNFVKVKER